MNSETTRRSGDLLRLFIIDRLGSSLLHDLRNGLQAMLGNTALLRTQITGLSSSSDIPHKLQASVDKFSRGVTDLNTILALPGQQNTVVRMNTALRNGRPYFLNILKERRALNMELERAAEGVRVLQQPLSQLVLLWILRARDLLPAQGICKLRTDLSAEQPESALLYLEDDGPAIGDAAKSELLHPAEQPPSDPEAYLFWLCGTLLQSIGAQLSTATLPVGNQLLIRWPAIKAPAPPSSPPPAVRTDNASG